MPPLPSLRNELVRPDATERGGDDGHRRGRQASRRLCCVQGTPWPHRRSTVSRDKIRTQAAGVACLGHARPMPLPDDETFKDPRTPRRHDAARATVLFVLFEGERLAAGGARHALAHLDEVRLGRGDARTVRRGVTDGVRWLDLRLPDRRMSGAHLLLTRTADRWMAKRRGVDERLATQRAAAPEPGRSSSMATSSSWDGQSFAFAKGSRCPPTRRSTSTPQLARCKTRGSRRLMPEGALALADLERVARSEVSIVLLGETGTGKEVLARAIHGRSERAARGGPMVAVNCGALPDALVESQLFGHAVKGAFSGAGRDEPGFVRSADGGTLFLDEIGDLPATSQAALLRVLQEREVTPVGAVRAIPVDLRVVAATNRPLDAMVARGVLPQGSLRALVSGLRARARAAARAPGRTSACWPPILLASSERRGASVAQRRTQRAPSCATNWPLLNARYRRPVARARSSRAEDGSHRSVSHLPATLARDVEPEELTPVPRARGLSLRGRRAPARRARARARQARRQRDRGGADARQGQNAGAPLDQAVRPRHGDVQEELTPPWRSFRDHAIVVVLVGASSAEGREPRGLADRVEPAAALARVSRTLTGHARSGQETVAIVAVEVRNGAPCRRRGPFRWRPWPSSSIPRSSAADGPTRCPPARSAQRRGLDVEVEARRRHPGRGVVRKVLPPGSTAVPQSCATPIPIPASGGALRS